MHLEKAISLTHNLMPIHTRRSIDDRDVAGMYILNKINVLGAFILSDGRF